MTLSYSGPTDVGFRRRTIHSAPPVDIITDDGLRDAAARWHHLCADSDAARRDLDEAQAAVDEASRRDARALAEAIQQGSKTLPKETVHAVRARFDEKRRMATATADAVELVGRALAKEAARVAEPNSPEMMRLRAEDEQFAQREAQALQALEDVRAERRRGRAYMDWLNNPRSVSVRWR